MASILLLEDILHRRFGIQVPRSPKFYSALEERVAELDPRLKDKIAYLRMRRNTADYDLELAFDKQDANRAIYQAKRVTTWLSEKFC